MRSKFPRLALAIVLCLHSALSFAQSASPAITLDEYLNTTYILGAVLSPDGSAAVISTEVPDWKASLNRHDLWLWTAQAGLRPLTRSGSDEKPRWSPDGKWIAFTSERPLNTVSETDTDTAKATRIWLISSTGGEAIPLFTDKLDVHSFAWSPDSSTIYFAATAPLTHDQEDEQKDEWKDVIRWREQNRGDVLLRLPLAQAVARAAETAPAAAAPSAADADAEPAARLPESAKSIATSDLYIDEIAPSPDGKLVAFTTEPVHFREENIADYEIYLAASEGGSANRLTHNEAVESGLTWSPDSHWLHFAVQGGFGAIDGKYRELQGRLYRIDPVSGKLERLAASCDASFDQFILLPDGRELALGLKGTETQLYLVDGERAARLPGQAGTYTGIASGRASNAILLRHSTITAPEQAYIASDPLQPDHVSAITSFNPQFARAAQPEWQNYTWKSDDGRSIEGVLIFPPGRKGAKHLRMLTLIHGGPADADGNHFGADWYDWATLAAANGWLVFRPNYRGSTGYGDAFMLEIAPHILSVPGRDILTGVDALVKDGYADPDHLAVGGYSYGGYLTNWLITQTTRFRSAVSGAGAVEHAANWGNDDTTLEDAWYLGGLPWEKPEMYQSEAALFHFDKVKTPTHLVQGGSDIRVSYLEGETMERALQTLGVPHTFLVFPGEGHDLEKNPWHGYIKLREELKWLEKYDAK
jgi:dipeptidyl aminopeptidase/acylaminoacyl peptidase